MKKKNVSTQSADERRALIAKMPPEASRLQVEDEVGKPRWREVADILDTDTILVNAQGGPFVMKGKPGRKSVPVTTAQASTSAITDILKRKKALTATDPVKNATMAAPESAEVLSLVMTALADEAASLHFERTEAERVGRETSAISIRRVNALKAIGDTWLKRKEQITEKDIDFESPSFRALFGHVLHTFRAAMENTNVRPELIETIFARVASMMDKEWETETRVRMKKATG